jgi:hypothetical protein
VHRQRRASRRTGARAADRRPVMQARCIGNVRPRGARPGHGRGTGGLDQDARTTRGIRGSVELMTTDQVRA